MQDGQRIQNSPQNSQAREPFGHQAPTLLAYKAHANEMAPATKSAARLAAEAAFAAPPVQSLPQPTAKIILRRTRSAGMAIKPTPEAGDNPSSALTAKGPRVFRVEAPPTPRSVEASFAALPLSIQASTHNGTLPAEGPARPNVRRIATDKRPGPVLHVIHAPPERDLETGAPQQQLRLLTGELERMTPVLELIARAQSFSLVDERVTREWLRLSCKLDKLHAQIRAQLS